MPNLVTLESPELSQIEPSKAAQIKSTFEPMVAMLEGFEKQYGEIITAAQNGIDEPLTARAKRCRLDIAKIRIDAERVRKEQKEEYLRAGKAIDGVSNILKWAVSDREAKLKEIEDHFELIEKARLEAVQNERATELSKYVEDAHERDLSSMDDEVWAAYISTKKKEYDDRIEAEKQAELARQEAERKDNLRRERERVVLPLSQYSDSELPDLGEIEEADYKKLLASLEKAKADYLAEQEKVRKEREAAEKQLEAERKKAEAERKAHEEAMRKEREAREKIEAEQRKKAEAEAKAKADEESRLKAAQSAPDKDKLKAWVDGLPSDIPTVKSKSASAVALEIASKYDGFRRWAKQQIESI
jgi:hypothetical protein